MSKWRWFVAAPVILALFVLATPVWALFLIAIGAQHVSNGAMWLGHHVEWPLRQISGPVVDWAIRDKRASRGRGE